MKESMKIAYCGNFGVEFTTETHIKKALESLGHAVLPLQENETPLSRMYDAIIALDADLFLYTRTWGLLSDGGQFLMPPGPTQQGLDFLEALPCPSASVHLDLYAGLKRGDGLAADPFWRTDWVFSADGGSPAFFARHGINHHWLRPGVDAAGCYLAEPVDELRHDVIFVGCSGQEPDLYHPEWAYRGELVNMLATCYRGRFKRWGGSDGTMREHRLNQVYASSKVVVGDSLVLGPEDALAPKFTHERYWSDRVYETIGRGGVLVMPYIAGLEEEFSDEQHLLYYDFGDFDHLMYQVDRLLGDDALRERIRRDGLTQVRSRCTYAHRMDEMLRTIAQTVP